MYSLNEKENAIELMKKGTSIKETVLTTGISKTTILKWKKELELRKHIKQLIESGKLEEAKKEVEKITGKVNEPIRNSILIRIAIEERDIETQERLIDRQLELNPNDVKAMKRRRIIAKKGRNVETKKSSLDKHLKLNPNDVQAIISRIGIAREEGDLETEKRLLDRLLELEPYNKIAIIRKTKYSQKRER